MSLLLDIFGYLTVLLRGATLVAQSVALGGIAFSLLLAEPLAARYGEAGVVALERSRRLTAWSGCALALLVAVSLGGQTAILASSTGRATGAALVFPLASAIAGVLLLTHSHTLGNVKELLLVEMTHAPLALFGVAAGWARWVELRTDPSESRVAAWIWPVCFAFIGLILVLYREA